MGSTQRRVVITGLGMISPIGNTKAAVWDSLSAGRSGVGRLGSVSIDGFPVRYAAEARAFQGTMDDFGPLGKEQSKAIRKGLKVMCRECQMGVAASQLALADSGLSAGSFDPERAGISFGTDHVLTLPDDFTEGVRQCLDESGGFQFDRWGESGMPKMSPLWLLKYLPNMPASHLAIYNDLRGPNNSVTLREAAFHVALVEAFQIVAGGRADAMVVGATGTRLHPIKIVHALQQEEVATADCDPAAASRPFDKNRMGMVLGEGAGAVVIEDLQTAEARGAAVYAELLGGASSSSVGPNLVARRDQAMKNALASALKHCGVTPEQVGFLNAHGLATRTCDVEEARAIQSVFGGRAGPVPVVAMKSYFGNLGAGGAAVELIAGVMALQNQRLPAVLNYTTPDPECPLAVVVDGGQSPGGSFVSLSVTPQGQASASLVAAFDG
jgi:3-oxoacyl-[acyl-carrier-protein] synthase II